jgi:hypothetical protein
MEKSFSSKIGVLLAALTRGLIHLFGHSALDSTNRHCHHFPAITQYYLIYPPNLQNLKLIEI